MIDDRESSVQVQGLRNCKRNTVSHTRGKWISNHEARSILRRERPVSDARTRPFGRTSRPDQSMTIAFYTIISRLVCENGYC